MYEYKDDKLCIPASILYKDFKLISYSLYKNKEFRKKLCFVQAGGNGRKALIDFNGLPVDIKKAVIDKIGEPDKNGPQCRIEHHYNEDMKARLFFESYTLPDGRRLEEKHIEEYTANASMLAAIELTVNETIIARKSRGGTGKPDWKSIALTVAALKKKKDDEGEYLYRHTLQESDRRLRDELNKFRKEGYISLLSGKFMNKNTAKITDEKQEALLQEIFANGRNLDNATITKMYNAFANQAGWKTITAAAVSQWRKKLKRITEPGRRGTKHYQNTFSMQVKRSRPNAPLYYWTADGWVAELLYQKTTVTKKGRVTTYHHRLTVVVILDAFNNYPVGYAIGERECPELIQEALRNAVNHTKELFGQRYRTWWIFR